jgi:hypothetical protein
MSPANTQTLRKTTHAFCQALLSPLPPKDLLTQFFTSSPRITEHGPEWANKRLPFLGKTFCGFDACVEYFNVLAEVLEMQLPRDAFPASEHFVVDAEAGQVCCVGKGTFVSKKTGKKWSEQFAYRFGEFDEQGGIGHWEIWADPLSAWVAVGGEEV